MGFFTHQTVRRQVTVKGQKLPQIFDEGRIIEGRVLAAAGEPVRDRYGREYLGVKVEIEPGYDKGIYSADPLVQAQIRDLTPGDIIDVSGPQRRGGAIRATSIVVVRKADVSPAVA